MTNDFNSQKNTHNHPNLILIDAGEFEFWIQEIESQKLKLCKKIIWQKSVLQSYKGQKFQNILSNAWTFQPFWNLSEISNNILSSIVFWVFDLLFHNSRKRSKWIFQYRTIIFANHFLDHILQVSAEFRKICFPLFSFLGKFFQPDYADDYPHTFLKLFPGSSVHVEFQRNRNWSSNTETSCFSILS